MGVLCSGANTSPYSPDHRRCDGTRDKRDDSKNRPSKSNYGLRGENN